MTELTTQGKVTQLYCLTKLMVWLVMLILMNQDTA